MTDQAGGARWAIGGGHVIPLHTPALIAVLNVTPDSFSDAGRHAHPDAALDRARQVADEGAAIIDVGGESTRPGATRVDPDEQIRRTLPVIQRIRDENLPLHVSIDTTRAPVARAALEAGATIINDVSAGTEDPDILHAAAEHHAGLILMHRLRPPDHDKYSDRYDDAGRPDYAPEGGVVAAVRNALERAAERALAAGVPHESIVLDPGLGFGKTVEQNLALIAHTHALRRLGFPLLSGASRKSFLGRVSNVDEPAARIHATIAVSVAHCLAGIRLFRVHDVAAHAQALAAAMAIVHAAAEHE